jgi:hypothetical protein
VSALVEYRSITCIVSYGDPNILQAVCLRNYFKR